MKTLIACLLLLIAAPVFSQATNEQLLYEIEARQRLLGDIAKLAQTIETLKSSAPAIQALLADLNYQGLAPFFDEITKSSKSYDLQDRATALSELVKISQDLEKLQEVSPDTLQLLATLQGAPSIDALLQQTLGSQPQAEYGPPTLLFARPQTLDQSAEVGLRFGQSKQTHLLAVGDSIKTTDNQTYTLQSVDIISERPLQLNILLQHGKKTLIMEF